MYVRFVQLLQGQQRQEAPFDMSLSTFVLTSKYLHVLIALLAAYLFSTTLSLRGLDIQQPCPIPLAGNARLFTS